MKHMPAFKAALVAAAGIITGNSLQSFSQVFLAGAVSALLLSSGWLLVRRERESVIVTYGAYTALFLSFAFSMSLNLTSLSDLRLGEYTFYSGTVEEVSPDSTKPWVTLSDCCGYREGWHEINGDVCLSPKNYIPVVPGDRIIVEGTPAAVSEARNPGQLNLRNYYRLKGLAGRIFLQSGRDIITVQRSKGFNFRRSIVVPIRDFARRKTRLLLKGDAAELALAMVLGERSGISPQINELFMNSGTIHILSVSGLHIGFLTGILTSIASVFRIPRRWRLSMIAPVLILYAFVVGLTPSVVRAVIMAIVVLFGIFIQRRTNLINSLGFAALCILSFSPAQLFSAGFQLSFAAVLSIAFFYERMAASIRRSRPGILESPVVNAAVNASILTVAATIGTVPLTVYYFDRISLVSVLANLVVVPLSGMFTSMNFTFLAASLFSDSLASIFAAASHLIGLIILKFNSAVGSLSFSIIRVDSPTMLFGALYFAWLIAVFRFGGRSLGKKLIFGMLLAADIILLSSIFADRAASRVYVLDVGQGDAVYIELPDGRNLLVDAGMKFGKSDAGARVVVPFLRKRGVGRIDHLVVTHLHSDHVGGLISVMRNVRIGDFVFPDQVSRSSIWSGSISAVRALNIPARTVSAGMVIDSGSNYRVYVIHPNRRYVGNAGLSTKTRFNDGSIVLKICIGNHSILLAGDIERRVESELTRAYGTFLSSTVLKVAHHGSSTGTSEKFIDAVRPRLAVISVGAGNRFGHPSGSVVAGLERHGADVWRTDSLGAAVVEISGGGARFVDWR